MAMRSIEEAYRSLPPDLQREVDAFIRAIQFGNRPTRRPTLKWRGALRHLREKYSSVQLQHEALNWWGR